MHVDHECPVSWSPDKRALDLSSKLDVTYMHQCNTCRSCGLNSVLPPPSPRSQSYIASFLLGLHSSSHHSAMLFRQWSYTSNHSYIIQLSACTIAVYLFDRRYFATSHFLLRSSIGKLIGLIFRYLRSWEREVMKLYFSSCPSLTSK